MFFFNSASSVRYLNKNAMKLGSHQYIYIYIYFTLKEGEFAYVIKRAPKIEDCQIFQAYGIEGLFLNDRMPDSTEGFSGG